MEQTEIKVRSSDVQIEDVEVIVCEIPTDLPESDGTLQWNQTTIVIVELAAEGQRGLGYTYGHSAIGTLIRDKLAALVRGMNPLDIPACWKVLTTAVRNDGDTGLCRMAVSAVDAALWDLKAKLLDLPLSSSSARYARRRRPMAAGGSLPTRSRSCRSSWAAGPKKASRW
jgi:L-alanine-DL-glutamate epimerase-like enolase superfamily enzyme